MRDFGPAHIKLSLKGQGHDLYLNNFVYLGCLEENVFG